MASDEADPAWVAADMLSQAEHASDSSAVVATDSEPLARAILQQLSIQLEDLPRADDARASLMRFSRVIVVENLGAAVALADEFASEHLEIQCGSRSREVADRINNAGAIFIGPHTPVAVGDYWAGPSHTLPTGTRAKFSSALTSNDFIKSTSLIEYSAEQLAASADDIIRLAQSRRPRRPRPQRRHPPAFVVTPSGVLRPLCPCGHTTNRVRQMSQSSRSSLSG